MPRRAASKTQTAGTAQKAMSDYRHAAKRKNNPPAKIAAEGVVPAIPKAQYAYNPHLPPVLRFDTTGESDQLPELLQTAQQPYASFCNVYHIHRATERYQLAGLAIDGHAEVATVYNSFEGALRTFLDFYRFTRPSATFPLLGPLGGSQP